MTAVQDWGIVGPGSSDAELAVAAAAGNRRAFAGIYDRYANRLHDFCAGMLADRDAAADCVQDAFCEAATCLRDLREPDKLRPWLYGIARHQCLRRLRDRRRAQPSDALPDTASAEAGPDALARRTELADLAAEAAGGLSDCDRSVLELSYRHELNPPELAEVLGVSQSNANTMVHRLRETMERSLGDPVALLGTTPVFLPAPDWLRDKTLNQIQLTSSAIDGTQEGEKRDRSRLKLLIALLVGLPLVAFGLTIVVVRLPDSAVAPSGDTQKVPSVTNGNPAGLTPTAGTPQKAAPTSAPRNISPALIPQPAQANSPAPPAFAPSQPGPTVAKNEQAQRPTTQQARTFTPAPAQQAPAPEPAAPPVPIQDQVGIQERHSPPVDDATITVPYPR